MPGHAAALVLALTALAPAGARAAAHDATPPPMPAAGTAVKVVFGARRHPAECLAFVRESMPTKEDADATGRPAVGESRAAEVRVAAGASWRFGLRAPRTGPGPLWSLADRWPPDRSTASAWRAVVTTCQVPPWAPAARGR